MFFLHEFQSRISRKIMIGSLVGLLLLLFNALAIQPLLEIAKSDWGCCLIQILLSLCVMFIVISIYYAQEVCLLKRKVRIQKTLAKKAWKERELDKLSGLKNRNAFMRTAECLEKGGEMVTIILCDIDGLKIINDTLGHLVGDTMIQSTAQILKMICPKNGDVFRIGGDEYVILIYEKMLEVDFEHFRELIKEQLSQYNESSIFPLSLSVGFASTSSLLPKFGDVLKEADCRMYEEKRSCHDKVYQCLKRAFQQ